jgi:hypothetical protein
VRAGTYRYRQSGTNTAGATSMAVPPEGTLRVDPPSGSTQVWHRATDPNQPPSDTTLQFRPDGMWITSQIQRVTVAGQTSQFSCGFPTPMPAPPWPPTVGANFTGHGDCGTFTVDVTGRITSTRTVTLDGISVPVFIIESSLTTHGQVQSSATETDWFSPALRLAVHTETHGSGTYGIVSYRTDTVADLESTKPT